MQFALTGKSTTYKKTKEKKNKTKEIQVNFWLSPLREVTAKCYLLEQINHWESGIKKPCFTIN